VLLEGASDPNISKIRLGNTEERENTIYHYNDDFEEVVKLIKKRINEKPSNKLDEDFKLKVNGQLIPLTDFPSAFIKNTIIGMLKSLKGVNEIKKVELNFSC